MCMSCKKAGKPLAAVWWRVSSDDQRELNTETQQRESLELAARQGFTVPAEYLLGTDWHGLTVWESPAMEKLKELVRSQSIHAVFMYDPDRGPSKPAHPLLFRAPCEDNGVKVQSIHGQIPEGDMGEVMEFLSAWQKEKQVMRAQQGAKDGLRDRAVLRGLPAVPKSPLGYIWNKNNPRRLVPGSGWEAASTIWRLAFEGTSVRRIAHELSARGFLTATGRTLWRPNTVWQVLNNPVYAGRYYALRYEAMTPVKRLTDTYGKSSQRLRPGTGETGWDAKSTNWVWLKDAVVERPIVTWEEFLMVQQRLDRNKALALANATSKHFYLLRGIVTCQLCGATYMGKAHRKKYVYYMCGRCRKRVKGAPKCNNQSIPGEQLETKVWEAVGAFLSSPETVMAELHRKESDLSESGEILAKEFSNLDKRLADLDGQEAELVALRVRKAEDGTPLVSDAAFERNAALIKAQRSWVNEEKQRVQQRIASLLYQGQAIQEIQKLRVKVADKLVRAGPQDRRWILDALNTKVLVWPDKILVEIGVGIPVRDPSIAATVSTRPGS